MPGQRDAAQTVLKWDGGMGTGLDWTGLGKKENNYEWDPSSETAGERGKIWGKIHSESGRQPRALFDHCYKGREAGEGNRPSGLT